MPPRKDRSNAAPSKTQQDVGSEGIEDVELPKLLVTQLAHAGIHPGFQLEDETITALVKSATVFINHLTSAAHEVATSRTHKTISAADVSKALENINFPALETCAERFQNEVEIFKQGMKHDKGKNKVPESKTKAKEKEKEKEKEREKEKEKEKGKEKDPSSPATVTLAQSHQKHDDIVAGVIVPEPEDAHIDVEMHDG